MHVCARDAMPCHTHGARQTHTPLLTSAYSATQTRYFGIWRGHRCWYGASLIRSLIPCLPRQAAQHRYAIIQCRTRLLVAEITGTYIALGVHIGALGDQVGHHIEFTTVAGHHKGRPSVLPRWIHASVSNQIMPRPPTPAPAVVSPHTDGSQPSFPTHKYQRRIRYKATY